MAYFILVIEAKTKMNKLKTKYKLFEIKAPFTLALETGFKSAGLGKPHPLLGGAWFTESGFQSALEVFTQLP